MTTIVALCGCGCRDCRCRRVFQGSFLSKTKGPIGRDNSPQLLFLLLLLLLSTPRAICSECECCSEHFVDDSPCCCCCCSSWRSCSWRSDDPKETTTTTWETRRGNIVCAECKAYRSHRTHSAGHVYQSRLVLCCFRFPEASDLTNQ